MSWRVGGAWALTVNGLLDGQVVLDIECLDRIYLSGFVNSLQTPGGVIYFLHHHRGMPIASPAVFTGIGDRFRRSVSSLRRTTSRWSASKGMSARLM